MSLGEEVLILFAGVRGFIDKYAVETLKKYEAESLNFVKTKYPEVLKEIDEKQIISDELEEKLRSVLTEFDTVFAAE